MNCSGSELGILIPKKEWTERELIGMNCSAFNPYHWNQINLSVCTVLKDLAEIAEKPPDLHDSFKGTTSLTKCPVELSHNSSSVHKFQSPLLSLVPLCSFLMLEAVTDQVCPWHLFSAHTAYGKSWQLKPAFAHDEVMLMQLQHETGHSSGRWRSRELPLFPPASGAAAVMCTLMAAEEGPAVLPGPYPSLNRVGLSSACFSAQFPTAWRCRVVKRTAAFVFTLCGGSTPLLPHPVHLLQMKLSLGPLSGQL